MSLRTTDSTTAWLLALGRENKVEAREAFEALWTVARPRALRQLARLGVDRDEAEEVAQEAGTLLWRHRAEIRARSPGEWYRLLRVTVRREMLRRVARRPAEQGLDLDLASEIPDEDLPHIDALVVAADEMERVYEAADRLWLGETEDREDAILGAAVLKLALADGMGMDRAASTLGATKADVERWLASPPVVARAAFAALRWGGDALASRLLRPDRPLSTEELDRIVRGDPSVEGLAWGPREARIVALWVRHALNEEETIRAIGEGIRRDDVAQAVSRARQSYPFRGVVRALLGGPSVSGLAGLLAQDRLWKRLALEYRARQGLPLRHVAERTEPPAEEAGYDFGPSTLYNWLSVGRIYAALAAYLQEKT